jgi:hypothetical protein
LPSLVDPDANEEGDDENIPPDVPELSTAPIEDRADPYGFAEGDSAAGKSPMLHKSKSKFVPNLVSTDNWKVNRSWIKITPPVKNMLIDFCEYQTAGSIAFQ